MKRDIIFLKAVYFIGIIVDGFWAFLLAFPNFYKVITNKPDFLLVEETKAIFFLADSLMLGWTVLLYMGFRKPVERRFILFITAFPVVLGIFLSTLYSVIHGSSIAIVFSIKTFLIMILYFLAFRKAENMSKKTA